MAFAAVIKHNVRVTTAPLTVAVVQGIANAMAQRIKDRIQSGINVYDKPAPPLKRSPNPKYKSYGDYKVMFGGNNLRDWTRPPAMGKVFERTKIYNIKTKRMAFDIAANRYSYGITMRAMGVLEVGAQRSPGDSILGWFRIGFRNPIAMQRAAFNNQRHRQFGVSPADLSFLNSELMHYLPATITTVPYVGPKGAA